MDQDLTTLTPTQCVLPCPTPVSSWTVFAVLMHFHIYSSPGFTAIGSIALSLWQEGVSITQSTQSQICPVTGVCAGDQTGDHNPVLGVVEYSIMLCEEVSLWLV